MHALLNVNKPPGLTSRDAVNHVQRIIRPVKVGHAGTLDPIASGVLVLGLGSGTRLMYLIQRMRKQYRATFQLGRKSPTDDVEGEVSEIASAPQPSLDEIRRAAASWTGEVMQQPPAFSALKVKGKRAHELARAGKTVELEPRPVTIYGIDVVRYDYPELCLDVECGGGTYIRSLGRDVAEALGTAAVMSDLVRTAIGSFRIEEAVDLDQIEEDSFSKACLPLSRAAEELPAVTLSPAEQQTIRFGQTISRPGLPTSDDYAAYDQRGELVAILRPRDEGMLGPAINLAT